MNRTPITKELKKHSSRLVGGAEVGSWGEEDVRQGSAPCEWSHIHAKRSQEEKQGSKTDLKTQGFSTRN